jgi:hypothetical protein
VRGAVPPGHPLRDERGAVTTLHRSERAVRYGLGVPTWEYASVITANDAESERAGVSIKLPGGQSERQQGDTSSVLNKLGAEGWELVSYHSSGAGTWGFEQFWLKRRSTD